MDASLRGALGLRPGRDEDDLRWFFNHDPQPSGIVSGYPALVRRLLLKRQGRGNPRPAQDIDENLLDDADRQRRIQRILDATPESSVSILRAALERTPGVIPGYGGVGGLVAHVLEAEIAHAASKSRMPLRSWLGALHRRSKEQLHARQTKEAILLAAHLALKRALLDYREGKRRTGSTGRADRAPDFVLERMPCTN